MSITYDKYKKNCGNCVYWCGERTPYPIQKYFRVEAGTTGRCAKTLNPRILCNATCSKFELHPICK